MKRTPRMPRDPEDESLAKWLESLNCPVQLTSNDLKQLNTPEMRSVWRHLQEHVKTVQQIQNIKKNLLLAKIKKIGSHHILPGKFENVEIKSVQDLSQLQKTCNMEDEVNNLKSEIKAVSETFPSLIGSLVEKVNEREYVKCDTKEKEDKTTLLKLKHSKILKDIDEINDNIRTAGLLTISQSSYFNSDLNHQKAVVAKYVNDYKYSFHATGEHDHYISQMVTSVLKFPPNIILKGIHEVSNQTLRSLRSFNSNLDPSANVNEKLALSGIVPFSKQMSNLKFLLIKHELDLSNCLEQLRRESAELEKEKATLLTAFNQLCTDSRKANTDDVFEKEDLETLLINTVEFKRKQKLNDLIDELKCDCTHYNDCKSKVITLGEKEKYLRTEVNMKANDLDELVASVFQSDVISKKVDILQNCTQQTSDFFAMFKLKNEEYKNNFLACGDVMLEEIEKFQNTPLIVLSRKWQTDELLPGDVKQALSNNPQMMQLLCQSEANNVIKSVLEKLYWYLDLQ